MYSAKTTKQRIKELAKQRKVNMESVLETCELGVNAIRQINDKKGMASFSLAKIADYLDCSVDYLLGRTDVVEVNRGVKIIVDDGKTVTPYIAAYDGSTPDNVHLSLKNIKELDDEN